MVEFCEKCDSLLKSKKVDLGYTLLVCNCGWKKRIYKKNNHTYKSELLDPKKKKSEGGIPYISRREWHSHYRNKRKGGK